MLCFQDRNSSAPAVHAGSNRITTREGLLSINSMQAEVYTGVNDYAHKARKPYTITKQRERWTEEEHKKFLEALKLYGRAWRKIEEHVGSKTAVQIRSHAQKFFSKVVRESGGNNTSSLDPIEIPPPRPKRKPMHPYPRKMVHPNSKESITQEQSVRSESPNVSVSDLENQSPTSVLSTIGSDAFASTGSSTPVRGFSPDSSTEDTQIHDSVLSEANLQVEDNLCTSVPTGVPNPTKNLELFPRIGTASKPVASKAVSQSLKLFGRTVVVNESSSISSSSISDRVTHPADSIHPMWGKFAQGGSGPIYLVQIQDSNSQLIEAGSATSVPCWTVYGDVPISYIPFLDGKESPKDHPESTSVTPCSHSGTSSALEFNEKNEVQSRLPPANKEVGSAKPKASPQKPARGFVPYKRCKLEKPTQSFTGVAQEMDEERIRLSL